MIILLQCVATQFRRLFWHFSYYKKQQTNFITRCDKFLLQSASGITKYDRLLLRGASGITKFDRLYCKVRQVLQSVKVITKWDVTQVAHSKILKKADDVRSLAVRSVFYAVIICVYLTNYNLL